MAVEIPILHLLARDWAEHGCGDLAAYTTRLYASIDAWLPQLPAAAHPVAHAIRSGDWLTGYRDLHTLGEIIERMAVRRMRRSKALPGGIEEFLADPDACAFAARWRAQRSRTGLG